MKGLPASRMKILGSMHTSADAAHENILKGRHLTEKNSWTILDLAVGLRQWGEDDISLFHA